MFKPPVISPSPSPGPPLAQMQIATTETSIPQEETTSNEQVIRDLKKKATEKVDDTYHLWFNTIGFGCTAILVTTFDICVFFYEPAIIPMAYVFLLFFSSYLGLDTLWVFIQPEIVTNNKNWTKGEVFGIIMHHILGTTTFYFAFWQFELDIIHVDNGYAMNEKYFIYAVCLSPAYIEWNTFLRELRRLLKQYHMIESGSCLYRIVTLLFDITWILTRLIMLGVITITVIYCAVTQYNTKLSVTWLVCSIIAVTVSILQCIWTVSWWYGARKRYCRKKRRNNKNNHSNDSNDIGSRLPRELKSQDIVHNQSSGVSLEVVEVEVDTPQTKIELR